MSVELLEREFSVAWFQSAAEHLPNFEELRRWVESDGLALDSTRATPRHAFRLVRHKQDTGLVVSTYANHVSMLYLATCYWATYEYEDHSDDVHSWRREYDLFNEEYERQLRRATDFFGVPSSHRVELISDDNPEIPSYVEKLKSASWSFRGCTLILLQAAYDSQFGLETSYWLLPKMLDICESGDQELATWLHSQAEEIR